ncbi:MAG: hypothetical protein ACYDAO_03300 [Thermoplasmataceae archaeon]
MNHYKRLFSSFIVFIIFIAAVSYSLIYTGEKVEKIGNPFSFVPENSTFIGYSQNNGVQFFMFVDNGQTGIVVHTLSEIGYNFSGLIEPPVNASIVISYIRNVGNYPIYEITTSISMMNSNSSVLVNKSNDSIPGINKSEVFISNPVPGIDIVGSLLSVEFSLKGYIEGNGMHAYLKKFIDLNSEFSFVYLFGNGFPISMICGNLMSGIYTLNITFNKTINLLDVFVALAEILPNYVTVIGIWITPEHSILLKVNKPKYYFLTNVINILISSLRL